MREQLRLQKDNLELESILTSILVNQERFGKGLIDTGCEVYALISDCFAKRCDLPRISIPLREITGITPDGFAVSELAYADIDIGGHCQKRMFFYVAPRLQGCDMMLGTPWLVKEKVVIDQSDRTLFFKNTGLFVKQDADLPKQQARPISAASFSMLARTAKKKKKKNNYQVFAASMADINKALQTKPLVDARTKLPPWVESRFVALFDKKEADKLPPHRPGIDHRIELEKDSNGKTPDAPWGPLYSMSRDELLVLRKTLNDLLDKGFIRVSNSPAAAPVLFVKKPGGGLRFCCDYRALNRLTRKDRYPLPLIQETLNRISRAKWFTKLDVSSAFHKIRVAEGDEWMTAFRTRFGLFEWLVTPFGLANAPSTFQRYINWTLRDFLDDFVSAYVDDILIFTEGSRKEHRRHVAKVLDKLLDAGLQLDIGKCEFEVQTTKYLGFIIDAGAGIRMDPMKIQAILDWQAPTTVRGVLGFLGFANFYRQFIKDFSKVTAPLTQLTKKDFKFEWNEPANAAFERLKKAFTTAPLLAQFDPERDTVLATDSSGYCTGGVLSQYSTEGVLRPVAYFSKQNLPAECNYPIYDKELMAIVKCLRHWDSELRGLPHFKILTDHKNLEYFATAKRLSERQIRWWRELSRFSFLIEYTPGKKNVLADALTRRDQDLPRDTTDERLLQRTAQLLQQLPEGLTVNSGSLSDPEDETQYYSNLMVSPARIQTPLATQTSLGQDIERLWHEATQQDPVIRRLQEAVKQGNRTFPPDLTTTIKVSIADCSCEGDTLLFRGRRWVPDFEPLRTKIIQALHDSTLSAHPGRTGTIALVARHFFWPNFVSDIRRFCRNCDVCGRTKIWRDRKQGLLKPLPVPSRQWREISVDFIGPLPKSQNCEMLMVITDRLSKGVILEACPNTETETIARLFLKCFYRHHGTPAAIVSDRGVQFVSLLWGRICQLLRIERRLSTAYHPQTDGSTERMNTEVERVLRMLVNHKQDDWSDWLPIVELALNGQTSASTQLSPFFLTHGYHLEPLDLSEPPGTEEVAAPDRAYAIVEKIKEATEWTQMAMAEAQQEQERQANKHRNPSPAYKVGDKVWLLLRNVRTGRPSKKLDDKAAKYTVTEVVGPYSYRLDIPGRRIHNVFHVDLLRPVGSDPLASQVQDDYHPPPLLTEGEDEWWAVEAILDERRHRRQLQYLVKWTGYTQPSWEPAREVRDTDALKDYLQAKERRGGGGMM